jgi:hypothetical protein
LTMRIKSTARRARALLKSLKRYCLASIKDDRQAMRALTQAATACKNRRAGVEL